MRARHALFAVRAAVLLVSLWALSLPVQAQTLLHAFAPEPATPSLGMALAPAGDLDGDGVLDVILGEPRAYGPGGLAGRVRVFSGASSTVLHLWNGGAPGDEFGGAVGGGGDVDGDGVPDVVVGTPHHDGGGLNAGQTRVYSGATGVLVWTWNGVAPYDYFGTSVAIVGDTDGDGRAEVVVGAPGRDVAGWDAGETVLFSGATGIPIHVWTGATQDDAFGRSVAAAGDVDGDGWPDVIVGAPFNDQNGSDAGEARVLSGSIGTPLSVWYGFAIGARFGYSVSGAGDVDGDGNDDLVVGSPGGPGQATVFSGATGSALHSWSPSWGPLYGHSVAGAGDVNGDGRPDLVVGAPAWGGSNGFAEVRSGATGALLQTLTTSFQNTGFSVAGAGDLDGDGKSDVLVGAPGDLTGSSPQTGTVKAFSGATGSILHTWDGVGVMPSFAYAVSSAGDADGDGSDDVLVGIRASLGLPGQAKVFSGTSGSAIHAWLGSAGGFGEAVAVVGDVNGDGRPDVAVGAPQAPPSGLGQVRVFSGATGLSILLLDGAAYSARKFGAAISRAGDLDGDGRADFAVGAPETQTTAYGAGRVFVLSGASGAVLRTLSGTQQDERSGWAVAGTEDANGDGWPDIAVGAPFHDTTALNVGKVTLFSGADGSTLRVWQGFLTGSYFGWSVGAAGDVDGDGNGDVVVGAPNNYAAGIAAGLVRVFSGATGGVLHTWFGSAAFDQFGYAVAGAGDANGDGYSDVVAGAPYSDAGGADAGRVVVLSSADGSVLDDVAGSHPFSRLGWTVAGAGRVDAGACEDFLAGTPYDQTTGRGAAYAYASSRGGLQGYTDLGHSIAGTNGLRPLLRGYGLPTPGNTVTLVAHRVLPGAPGLLGIGLATLYAPAFSGTIVPLPTVVLPFPSDAAGKATLSFVLPVPGPPSGTRIYAQAFFADSGAPQGVSATNGLSVALP